MTFTTVTNLIVYETNDYDKFSLIHENRLITINRELERVILERNKLKYNPIIVSQDMEVIDGQHRLQIAKEHDLTIYYIIDTDSQVNDIQMMNVGNKNWSQEDHLHFFVKLGYPNYIFMDRMIRTYEMSQSCFMMAMGSSDRSKIAKKFRAGLMELKHSFETMEQFCRDYQEIQNEFKYYSSKKYMTKAMQWTIMCLVSRIDYNHEHMMHKIGLHPDELIRANTFNNVENTRNVLINDIYNRKMAVSNRMALVPDLA